jgi:hypothetical protein
MDLLEITHYGGQSAVQPLHQEVTDQPELTVSKDPQKVQNDKSDVVPELLSIKVHLLGTEVPVTIEKFSCLELVITKAMDKLNVHTDNVYFLRDGETVPGGTLFLEDCILRSRHRLRGGNSPVRLKKYIKPLMKRRDWFERIEIPIDLQSPHSKVTYTVDLGDHSRSILRTVMLTHGRSMPRAKIGRGVPPPDTAAHRPPFLLP